MIPVLTAAPAPAGTDEAIDAALAAALERFRDTTSCPRYLRDAADAWLLAR